MQNRGRTARLPGSSWFNRRVKLHVTWISKTKEQAIGSLTGEYVKRIGRYIEVETHEFKSEEALLEWTERERIRPSLVVMDERGKQHSSEEFAKFINRHMERGTQSLAFCIGPADGFSDKTRAAATNTISLGKMILAHELARVVMLEQIYRAFTILKGHPYHLGH